MDEGGQPGRPLEQEAGVFALEILSQGLANCSLQAKAGPLPGFVNKVSLEHSHIYLLSMIAFLL
jgi:hypothetical protein